MRQLKIEEKRTVRTRNVDRYFVELNSKKKVTPDMEVELAKRIKEGDQKALKTLVEANLRFVVSVAKQYTSDPDTLSELIAQGNIGLIEAAQKYDHTTGFKFISYAVWYIRKEIMVYFNNFHKTIRIPTNIELEVRKIRNAEESLEMRLQRKPLPEEVVAELSSNGNEFTVDKIESVKKNHGCTAVPMDEKVGDSDWSPTDWLGDNDSQIEGIENSQEGLIESLISVLTPREAEIVINKLGLDGGVPKSHSYIGEMKGFSTERSRGIYRSAMKKMRMKYTKVSEFY